MKLACIAAIVHHRAGDNRWNGSDDDAAKMTR